MLAERAEDKEKFEAQAQEKKPPLLFAPAIFIDDDGQACYYWGQLYSHGVKMNPDMERGKPTSLGAGKPDPTPHPRAAAHRVADHGVSGAAAGAAALA